MNSLTHESVLGIGIHRIFIQVWAYLLHIQYCFKIPFFSPWTDCICGIHPARQNTVCSSGGILKKHYSTILLLPMHCDCRNLKISVQGGGSTLVVHKGLYFFYSVFVNKKNCDILSDVWHIALVACLHMLFFF